MRKVSTIIGAVCLTVLMAVSVSCKKNDTKTVSSFDCSFPPVEGVSALEEEKAYIDLTDNQLKWYNGDQVMVYSIDEDYNNSATAIYDVQANASGEVIGHFSGTPLAEGSVGYFVFYPADKASQTIEANNRAYFNVPDTQRHTVDLYKGTSYAGRIFMDHGSVVGASTCDAEVNGTLKHIFGYVTVKLKDSANSGKKVSSITIMDRGHFLTGSISIEIPKLTMSLLEGMKTLGQQYKAGGTNLDTYASSLNGYLHEIGYMPDQVGHMLTLDCTAAGGVQITNKNKYFMMSVRPGALMGGFFVTVTFTEGSPVIFEVPADPKYITIPGTYTNVSIDLASGVL